MDPSGLPSPFFLSFLKEFEPPFLVCLNDIQLRNSDVAWQNFMRAMNSSDTRVLGINGPRGEAMLASKDIYEAHNWSFPECPKNSDHVEFQLRRFNVKQSETRLIIIAPYFAYEPTERKNPTKAVAAARAATMVPGNVVFMVGDMNLGRYHKAGYAQSLMGAGFTRIETPITGKPVPLKKGGFGGGRAQAIWSTHPELVDPELVRVLPNFDMLSDHHRPVVFEIPGFTKFVPPPRLDMKSGMRIVKNPSMYQKATREVQPGPGALANLYAVMFANTVVQPRAASKHKARPNAKDVADTIILPTRNELRKKLEKGKQRLIQMDVARTKKIFAAAYRNETLLKNLVFPKRHDERTMVPDANERMARVLTKRSWVVSPVRLHDYFGNFEGMYSSVSKDLKTALTAKYTASELHRNLRSLGLWKTYTDFEGRALHLFDMCTLGILADSFDERARGIDVEAMVRQIIGLPTGKKHFETEIDNILRKENRPIGLSAVIDALYYICQNARLAPIVAAVAPENMHGFIRGREGHDMIFEIFFAIELANMSQLKIYVVQGDIEKHFDQLPHDGISHLDKLLGLAEPFFATIVGKIRRTVNEIRVQPGEPGRATQFAGGSQGDQRVPSISALLLAPLALALKNNVAGSIPQDRYTEIKRLIRIVVNFADDWVFASDSLPDAMGRFHMAAEMCEFLGMNLKLVAVACNHHAVNPYIPNHVDYGGERFVIKAALRILGTCIHLRPHSACAKTKCKACDKQSESRICTECLPKAIRNLGSLPLPILDKAEIGNQRILASLIYGAYTCEAQQLIWENAATEIRYQIYGYGYGGYKVVSSLPALSGGIGMKSSREHLAIETANILERVMCRNGAAKEIVMAVRRHPRNADWPEPFARALMGTAETPVLKFDLHSTLRKDPQDRRSQDAPCQIEIMRIFVDPESVIMAVIGRSLTGTIRYYHEFEKRNPQHKIWKEEHLVRAQIRILARIVEKESSLSRRVVIKALPPNIAVVVSVFKLNNKRHYAKDRAYTSVLERTEIVSLTDDTSPPDAFPPAHETDHSVPELYPVSALSRGTPFVTTSLNYESLNTLRIHAEEQYRDCKQILEIIPREHHIDHENSACAAGVRRGVHYESFLKTSEANTHLRLVTGALLKTPVLAEEDTMPGTEPRPGEIKWGEKCKAQLKSSPEHPDMKGECGHPLTLAHIISHISEIEFDAVTNEVNKFSKFGHLNFPYIKRDYMAFGFMPKGLYKTVPLEKQKEFRKHMLKTSTTFARISQRQFLLCQQRQILDDTTPDYVIETGASISLNYEYLARADAAQLPGKNPGEPCTIGLGGHIIRISTGEEVKRFVVRRQIPTENSTLAEHFAHLVLSKMTASCGYNDTCFGSDNNAVPKQSEGNWKVNCEKIRIIRGVTATIKAGLPRHAEAWFPREENVRADELSKLALNGKEWFEPGWVEELDELLQELMEVT